MWIEQVIEQKKELSFLRTDLIMCELVVTISILTNEISSQNKLVPQSEPLTAMM